MKKTKELFVESEFLENLTKGSFEDMQSKIVEALHSDSRFRNAVPLATFKSNVVVLLPENKIERVRFSVEKTGITLRERESIDLPVYTQEEMKSSLSKELSESFSLYVAGRSDAALEKVSKILPAISEASRPLSYYVKKFESVCDEASLWEKVLRESSVLVSSPEKMELELSENASPDELETQRLSISESGQGLILSMRDQLREVKSIQVEKKHKTLVSSVESDVNRKLYCAKTVFDRGSATQEDIGLMVEVYNALLEISSRVKAVSSLLSVMGNSTT